MMKDWLAKFTETKWKGKGELWLDPEDNSAKIYDCELNIKNRAINYSWLYKNEIKKRCFTFDEHCINWVDSRHQQNSVQCSIVSNAWGIFIASHEYEVPDNPN